VTLSLMPAMTGGRLQKRKNAMKAVALGGNGALDRLRIVDVPEPQPGPTDVLVELEYSGVNSSDLKPRTRGRSPAGRGSPDIPGCEGAGTIAAVGREVDLSYVGQRAAFLTRRGAYATRACVPATQVVFGIPDEIRPSVAGGMSPSHRRAQLWTDIKKTLVHMRDEHHTVPIVVMDEAQHLSDRFLVDLSGFLNVAFDSRDVLTLWLVGLPTLRRHLEMQQHAPLAMRVTTQVHLEPFTDRAAFAAFVTQALAAVGATDKIVADPAMELLLRASRGLPRVASRLLRAALILAHEQDQSFVDEHVLEAVLDDALVTVHP